MPSRRVAVKLLHAQHHVVMSWRLCWLVGSFVSMETVLRGATRFISCMQIEERTIRHGDAG